MGSHRSRSSCIGSYRSRGSYWDRAGDTRHGRRLHMDISLSWDLGINIGHSRDILMNIRISRDLFMDISLSSNLLINRGSRQRSPGGARRR